MCVCVCARAGTHTVRTMGINTFKVLEQCLVQSGCSINISCNYLSVNDEFYLDSRRVWLRQVRAS